jgi:hypothetical protein
MKKKINQEYWYKIVDYKGEEVRTLFHSLNGTKNLPMNRWLSAERKIVTDGNWEKSTKYESGFHIMPTYKSCVDYLRRFTNVGCKGIVKCKARGIRPKEHSPSEIYLANRIMIVEKFFI